VRSKESGRTEASRQTFDEGELGPDPVASVAPPLPYFELRRLRTFFALSFVFLYSSSSYHHYGLETGALSGRNGVDGDGAVGLPVAMGGRDSAHAPEEYVSNVPIVFNNR
jgi:hypothetical protein